MTAFSCFHLCVCLCAMWHLSGDHEKLSESLNRSILLFLYMYTHNRIPQRRLRAPLQPRWDDASLILMPKQFPISLPFFPLSQWAPTALKLYSFFLMGKKEKYKVIERGVMNLWTRSGVRGSLADLVEIRHDHMGKKGFCQFSGSPYTACIRCVCLEPYSPLAHLRLDSQPRHF